MDQKLVLSSQISGVKQPKHIFVYLQRKVKTIEQELVKYLGMD